MKEIVQSKRISPVMLFALFALSMLLAPNARAQGEQALTQAESSSPARCSGNQLSLRNTGEVESMGAMRIIEFIFTNTSSSPCTLEGYPRLQFLNKSGQPAHGGLAVNDVIFESLYMAPPELTVTTVSIEPGKKAKFVINYLARYNEKSERPCPTYRKASVIAPGIERPFVQKFRGYGIEVCSGLRISPVFPASRFD